MYSVNDTQQAGWVSPFGNLRIKACLSTPRSLSQIATSFIASYRLGIHRMRLFTWPYNPKKSESCLQLKQISDSLKTKNLKSYVRLLTQTQHTSHMIINNNYPNEINHPNKRWIITKCLNLITTYNFQLFQIFKEHEQAYILSFQSKNQKKIPCI